MSFNSAPEFYICYPSPTPDIENIYIFHLIPPAWFGKVTPKSNGTQLDIITYFGPSPAKDIEAQTLKDAGEFVKIFFEEYNKNLLKYSLKK
ncbi:hypothetical protein [Pedobacter sp.]|jgi:hypothetical protein|uniref:hypothetical protein n=1 Tax=Pedobacter sp. TaxID=1411316 RepID=UPI002C40F579|nr:hypothetical protein [Pedobacter sp.]HWW42237.1 hypothetical protein [Pedobacter sp.]